MQGVTFCDGLNQAVFVSYGVFVIPELQNNISKCLTQKYTSTQVYKYTIQHKYTIRHKYSLVQIIAKNYALHVRLHLASKPNFLKDSDTRTSKQCF